MNISWLHKIQLCLMIQLEIILHMQNLMQADKEMEFEAAKHSFASEFIEKSTK